MLGVLVEEPGGSQPAGSAAYDCDPHGSVARDRGDEAGVSRWYVSCAVSMDWLARCVDRGCSVCCRRDEMDAVSSRESKGAKGRGSLDLGQHRLPSFPGLLPPTANYTTSVLPSIISRSSPHTQPTPRSLHSTSPNLSFVEPRVNKNSNSMARDRLVLTPVAPFAEQQYGHIQQSRGEEDEL